MASYQQYTPLPGSERVDPLGARQIGPADPDERIEVSVYLRSRPTTRSTSELNRRLLHRGGIMTRDEYAGIFGVHSDQFAQVEAFARSHNLVVLEANPVRRVIVLAGTVADMSAAFGVELNSYELESHTYRIRTGQVNVPHELSSIIEGVFGLDNRPQARPFVKVAPAAAVSSLMATSYTPPQVAGLYNFPTLGDGAGQCIGIIEFGGGYTEGDLSAYFAQLGIPLPQVSSVPVDGGQNAPIGDPTSADGEVMLDIEVIGAIAQGATIVVYFAPDTSDKSFIDAVTTAVFDTLRRPSVISISWGAPESYWTLQFMQTFDHALQAAALLGVTVCCASGDDGSEDQVYDGQAHADFPASSPFALACGGTRLESSGDGVTSEVVWNAYGATGGGISDVFDLPDWQVGAGVPSSINPGARVGRGVPDVAANADPTTGYQILVDGQETVIGGTSAAAPLWAALLALINQQLDEPIGYVNPLLYEQLIMETDVVHDITIGNNGGYQAVSGWDACTGLGTPNGANWLDALIY